MDSKRFVIWSAVSSLPQTKKISLSDQRVQALEHVARHGGIVVSELEVTGQSRSIVLFEDACKKIDAYAKLRDMLEAKNFDVLIYRDTSRLGRKSSLAMTVIELCREAGVITYDLESPPDSLDFAKSQTHDGMLMGAIKAVGAQQAVIKTSQLHNMGMRERVRRGDFPGIVPWGWLESYQMIGGQPQRIIEIDPLAQSALIMLCESYLSHGSGTRAIADKLQASGLPGPGDGAWRKDTVQFIIRRIRRYAGILEYNRKDTQSRPYIQSRMKWPALISEETADAITSEQKRRVSSRRSVGSPHRFSQCVWCAICDKPMIAEYTYSVNKKDKNRRYDREVYRCMSGDKHPGANITARKVFDDLSDFFTALQDENFLSATMLFVHDNTPSVGAKIAVIQSQIDATRPALERADSAFVTGIMDADRYEKQVAMINAKIRALNGQIEELSAKLENEKQNAGRPARVKDLATRGLAMLDEPDVQKAAAFFRSRLRIIARDCEIIKIECL